MSSVGAFPDTAIVVPTLARRSLSALLESLAVSVSAGNCGVPTAIYLVDDRGPSAGPLPCARSLWRGATPAVLRGPGRGPAAARNVGWRAARTTWVAFLDDDVVVTEGWWAQLCRDLAGATPDVAASKGRIIVPLETDSPSDFARNTAALERAQWITADMAFRRRALARVQGFDERFPRAYREDSDLALRLAAHGYRLSQGERMTMHPVRPAGWWVSVAQQAGNADNALMRKKHGPDWRARAGAGRGMLADHALTTATGLAAAIARSTARTRTSRRAALLLSVLWTLRTSKFTARRVLPGPRTADEIGRMAATSLLIPPIAVFHRAAGEWRHRHVERFAPRPPKVVLFDRDGTLVYDVPFNGDPRLVEPMPDARAALDALRDAGVRLGVVTNQSGVARGVLSAAQVRDVNQRVEALLGPFDHWEVCPHGPEDGCSCRKPEPGMILRAAHALGVEPEECAVIGDTGADVFAAERAGALAVMVPNERTRPEECHRASVTCSSLAEAVDFLLAGSRR